MAKFAVTRLGRDSVPDIEKLDTHNEPPDEPIVLSVTCSQVPEEFEAGHYVFIWLGSDNNKGSPTAWKQGLRALGKVLSKTGGPGWNDQWTIELSVGVVFSESIDRKDILGAASAAFFWCSDIPIIGLKQSSNQTVQLVKPDDPSQNVSALLYAVGAVDPKARDHIVTVYPELESLLEYIPPTPPKSSGAAKVGAVDKSTVSVSSDDPILSKVEKLISSGHTLILFVGPPGTGKTYYADLIARHLCAGDVDRIVQIQFHPSYSYDDFVEGYVPTGRLGGSTKEPLFSLRDKIFLKFCDEARNNRDKTYFLIIDEFSRGDMSRIFGELLTYIEPQYRGKPFTLAYSGRVISIPENFVVLGTMNPHDKSVAELDVALDRRFVKIPIDPDPKVVSMMLTKNGADKILIGKVVQFFANIQSSLPGGGLGHAFFRNIATEDDLIQLWEHELSFFFRREFQFDEGAYNEVRAKYQDLLGQDISLR